MAIGAIAALHLGARAIRKDVADIHDQYPNQENNP